MSKSDLAQPIARRGESQYVCILRNRSGINAGNIGFAIRTCAIEELADGEKQDIVNAAFAVYESICDTTCKKSTRDKNNTSEAKQVISELREWLINMDKLRVPSEWMFGLRYRNELENLKEIITELEQKYCKEEVTDNKNKGE